MQKKIVISILLAICIFSSSVGTASVYAAEDSEKGPVINANYTVLNQMATVVCDVTSSKKIKEVRYLYGSYTNANSSSWTKRGVDITDSLTFDAISSGEYSIKATDSDGNSTIEHIYLELEMRAVWISYLEFDSKGYTEKQFKKHIDQMFDNVVDMHMNAVVVHVRPFSDAMYASKYFPWSKYVSGTQGVSPGFDPLKYMVEAAHERNLSIHAWLNPYRVTTNNTDIFTLAANHPARKWLTDKNKDNDHNVISYGGNLYYNPASWEVRNLIINGVKEIVNNYDIDGIHLDDYFYPSFGSNYDKVFDAQEYTAYKTKQKQANKKVKSIEEWRRSNVNTLVKKIYSSIKAIDPFVEFGISPGGFLDYLSEKNRYYVDVDTWLSTDGYIDYICPQLYWSFSHSTFPFDKTLNRWLNLRTEDSKIKVYVGIPVYKAGSNEEVEFKKDADVLLNMINYSRDSGMVDGFIFYRYAYFQSKTTKKAVNNMFDILPLY